MNHRTAARTFAGVFAATLVMVGCTVAGDENTEATPPEEATPAEPTQHWEAVSSDEGSALVLLGEGDTQIFHMACLESPAQLQVIATGFTVIGSEERMTLSAANEAFGLVADVEREGPGVTASGAIDPSFLDHFARSEDISAVYGAQQVGPWPTPDAQMRGAFVQACRDIGVAGSAE